MDYPDLFTWRGLNFERVGQEDPLSFRHGNWHVWGEISEGREKIWWRARWQSTQFQPTLTSTGQADSWEQALELCLGRLRAHGRAHATKMEDLQRDLTLMGQERDALVRDLLLFILPEE